MAQRLGGGEEGKNIMLSELDAPEKNLTEWLTICEKTDSIQDSFKLILDGVKTDSDRLSAKSFIAGSSVNFGAAS
jgi:hypothetical protein